jgi:hypothetical protein
MKNFAHMKEHDWHRYIQEFTPEPNEVEEFINDLYQYAQRGNMESGIARFRMEGMGRKFPHVINTKQYRQTILIDKQNQNEIQEGFIRR